jgi:ankyrin repeat protein
MIHDFEENDMTLALKDFNKQLRDIDGKLSLDSFKALVEANLEYLQEFDSNGMLPIHHLARSKATVEQVDYFLEKVKANCPNVMNAFTRDKQQLTPIQHFIAGSNRDHAVYDKFIEYGTDPLLAANPKRNSFVIASSNPKNFNTAIISDLLKRDPSLINTKLPSGNTLLVEKALSYARCDITKTRKKANLLSFIEYLVNNGADCNLRAERGYTVVMIAVKWQDEVLFELVTRKDRSANAINFQYKEGLSLAHFAVIQGNAALLEKLSKLGASLDLVDDEDFDPVLRAVHAKKPNMIKKLIELNANFQRLDQKGLTAEAYASKIGGGREECQALLRNARIAMSAGRKDVDSAALVLLSLSSESTADTDLSPSAISQSLAAISIPADVPTSVPNDTEIETPPKDLGVGETSPLAKEPSAAEARLFYLLNDPIARVETLKVIFREYEKAKEDAKKTAEELAQARQKFKTARESAAPEKEIDAARKSKSLAKKQAKEAEGALEYRRTQLVNQVEAGGVLLNKLKNSPAGAAKVEDGKIEALAIKINELMTVVDSLAASSQAELFAGKKRQREGGDKQSFADREIKRAVKLDEGVSR